MRRFYLIRHAESLGNIALSGSADAGLSPLGRAQAARCSEALADMIGPDESVVLSSPMERCIDTAEMIVSNLELCEGVRLEPALCESFGDYNLPRGYKPPSLREKAVSRDFIVGDYDDSVWWSMERDDHQSLSVRMAMFRNYLMRAEFDDKAVVCVGHWPTVAALAAAMTPETRMRKVDNAAITKIVYDGDFKLEFSNATPVSLESESMGGE